VARIAFTSDRAWLAPGQVLDGAEVQVEDDTVAWIGARGSGPEAPKVVALGGFLMPAGADRHVHVAMHEPGEVLRRGVTAVRDLGWPADRIFPLADLSEGPGFDGPFIRAAGPMLTAPGGYPTGAFWAPVGTGLEVADAAEAAAAVAELASAGAVAIKVALNAEAGPTLGDATLLAIVGAAAAFDLPVTAHAQGVGQVERALGAGVAELAHTPWDPLPDDVLRRAAGVLRIVSTLDITSFGRDTPELGQALRNLERFLAAGGEVVYGTDLGNGSIPPGIHTRELQLLRRAGLDPDGVLQALIRAPLAVGAPADLIGLGADPLEDLRAFDDLSVVIRAGRIVV